MNKKKKKSKGKKWDGNKAMMALIPVHGEKELAKAMTNGLKYGKHNYLNGIEITRLLSAAKRHINDFLAGEDKASDSGVHHLGHCAANCLMVIEMMIVRPEMDDRFKYNKKKKHR